jgi:hypothetical protein
VKVKLLLLNALIFVSEGLAHAAHSEGHHTQNEVVLPQINPVLIGSLLMTATGIATLAVSIRKYRRDS